MNEHGQQPAHPDALIDEVRKVRAALSAQFDDDVRRLCDYLRQIEAQHPERIATPRHTDVHRS